MTISAGALQIGDGGTTGSIAGNITDNASLVFNRSNDLLYDGVISGTGAMTKLGAGTLILTGENTYTGGTTISAGTLQIGNGDTTGSIAGNIIDNAALDFDRNANITYANVISGTGSLTQQGGGVLLLTSDNTYTGPTLIHNGTLAVNGSIASDTTIDARGILTGGGTIFGNVENSGLVSPGTRGQKSSDFGMLTIAGNYTGSAGQLLIRGVFNGNNSPTDKLILSGGNASGDTQITLVNFGGKGAQTTGSGIPVVVTTNGATTNTDAFALTGGTVSIGKYNYTLVRGATPGTTAGVADAKIADAADDWFLQSKKAPTEPKPTPPTVSEGLRPEVALYSAVPAISRELGIISLGTFHQRQGEQFLLEGTGPVPAAWGRVIGEHTERNWSGTVDPSFEGTITGFQAGLDLYASERTNHDRDHLGVFAAYAQADGDISGLNLGKRSEVGQMEAQATSVGLYWTHIGPSGWYIDGVGMGSWYNPTPSSVDDLNASIDGAGMTLSLEGGYPIKILPTKLPSLVFEPQAQVIYQFTTFSDSHDRLSEIQFNDTSVFTGRLGGRVQVDCPVQDVILKPYLLANLWQHFAETDHLFMPDSGHIDTKNAATSLELGVGISAQLTNNLSIYGGGSYITNLDSNNEKTFFGDIGVRATW